MIDIGTTRVEGPEYQKGWAIKGDVDFKNVAAKASYITPVPGGVGPMTIACLLHNTVQAAKALSEDGGAEHDPYHDAPDRSLIYGTAEGGGQDALVRHSVHEA